jgi:hypothetical protein
MRKQYILYVIFGFVTAILLWVFHFDEMAWPQKILTGILMALGLGLCLRIAYYIFFTKKKAAS